jgi:hypothetical protein
MEVSARLRQNTSECFIISMPRPRISSRTAKVRFSQPAFDPRRNLNIQMEVSERLRQDTSAYFIVSLLRSVISSKRQKSNFHGWPSIHVASRAFSWNYRRNYGRTLEYFIVSMPRPRISSRTAKVKSSQPAFNPRRNLNIQMEVSERLRQNLAAYFIDTMHRPRNSSRTANIRFFQ